MFSVVCFRLPRHPCDITGRLIRGSAEMSTFLSFTVFFFLSLVSMTSTRPDDCCTTLRIQPKSLNLVYGENVTIACSIVNQSLRRRYNASNLVFKFVSLDADDGTSSSEDCDYSSSEENVVESDEIDSDDDDDDDDDVFAPSTPTGEYDPSNGSSEEDLSEYDNSDSGPFLKVDRGYVRAVGPYKVRLVYPALTRRFLDGFLKCYVDTGDDEPPCICAKAHILIGYRPAVPVVRRITVKNWEKVMFHWKTERRDDVYTNKYAAWYKLSSEEDFRRCSTYGRCQCSMDGKCTQSCEASVDLPLDRDLSPDSTMIFKVNVSNPVGVATSPEVTVDLYDIVTLYPVQVISVTVVNFSACVKFKSPNSDAELIYELLFKCSGEWKNTMSLPRSNASIQEGCMSNVPSYTKCRVAVRAKPYSYGKWSEWSNQQKFTTPQNVPLAAPDICRSCFEVLPTDDNDKAQIRIFLEPLPPAIARGRVIAYRASLTKIDLQRTEVSPSIEFSGESLERNINDLEVLSNYSVAVVAATEAGYNDSVTVTPVVINLAATKRHLAWPRNITAFIVNSTTVRMSWLCRHPKLTGFTVFWSRVATLNQTKDPMQWSHVPANVNRFEVTDLPPFYLQNYLFGVAVETADGYSSGVVWTKCLYNLSRVCGPPEVNSKVNGAKVQLNFSKNSECNAGFPYAYRVEYCPAFKDDTECHGESSTELVVEDDSVEVNHLISNKEYLFMVSSLSVAGPSLSNSIVKVEIPGQDGGSTLNTGPIVAISVIFLIVIGVVVMAVCYKRSCKKVNIETPPVVQPVNRLQPLPSTDDSESCPDYAHIHGNPHETFSDVHEDGSALSNGWPSNLTSSSAHLIPKNNLPIFLDPPFRGRRCNVENNNDDDDDNASVASDNTSADYTRTKLSDKTEVLPSSPPLEPIFEFDDESDSCSPNVTTMDLGKVGDDSPAPKISVNSGGSVSSGNSSKLSSCGYALGRMNDRHSGPSRSTDTDVSVEIPESGSGVVDAGNGRLPALCALDIDEPADDARNVRPLSHVLVLNDSPDGSISGSHYDVMGGDRLHPCSLDVEDGGGNDDGYNASILSSSDYAFANFKNKEHDPLLDTPAADVIYAASDCDDDDDSNEEGYAAVSLLNSKQTAYSTDSLLAQDTNIQHLTLSMSS